MIIFLTRGGFINPVRCLVNSLVSEFNIDAAIINTDHFNPESGLARYNNPTDTLVVRYGSTAFTNYFERDAAWSAHRNKIFNEFNAVLAASDKYSALEVLEVEGIAVPDRALVDDYLDSRAIQTSLGLPIVGRQFNHFGGHDLRLIQRTENARRNPRTGKTSDYILRFYENTEEYRVWTFSTKKYRRNTGRVLAIKAARKVDNGLIDRSRQFGSKRILKNRKNGYIFEWSENIPEEIRDMSRRATEALELDFAAIDIIHDLDEDRYILLEVNTAPGMSAESTIRLMSERFAQAHHKLIDRQT